MIEVLKQALEALGPNAPECCGCRAEWQIAIESLRQAIAELESQEPVAWAVYCDGFIALPSFDSELEARQEMQRRNRKFPHNKRKVKALYDTPPQRTWIGLTDDEHCDIWYKESLDWMEYGKAIEAKLKERNENSI